MSGARWITGTGPKDAPEEIPARATAESPWTSAGRCWSRVFINRSSGAELGRIVHGPCGCVLPVLLRLLLASEEDAREELTRAPWSPDWKPPAMSAAPAPWAP